MKKQVAYLGFSEALILTLLEHEKFNLKYVISQEGRLSATMEKLLSTLHIPCKIVRSKSELQKMAGLFSQCDIVLLHHFGIIVPESIYKNNLCFNIHSGDLETNRGPYPLTWDILLKRTKSVSTLHKLGDWIDTGAVISRYEVEINENDNMESISKKLDKGLKIHLDRLAQYDPDKNYIQIQDGVYRKRVTDEQITICDTDTIQEIKRKINAQSRYGGARLMHNGRVYRVSELLETEE